MNVYEHIRVTQENVAKFLQHIDEVGQVKILRFFTRVARSTE